MEHDGQIRYANDSKNLIYDKNITKNDYSLKNQDRHSSIPLFSVKPKDQGIPISLLFFFKPCAK